MTETKKVFTLLLMRRKNTRKTKESVQVKKRIRKSRKKNPSTFFIIGFFVVIGIGFVIFLYKNLAGDASIKPEITNPASVNCVKKGGTVEIKENIDGSQYGVCKFEDGRECEEWTLFTDNKCKSKY